MKKTSELNINALIETLYHNISNRIKNYSPEDVVMIGIHTGGLWIAEKLHQQLQLPNPLGSLNISFYRDDFTKIGLHPEVKPSQLPLSLDDKHIILVDDVLYTGRTIRAALNEIFDYGRPASVSLVILIDRGERELPICPDIAATQITLAKNEQIKLTGPDPLTLVIMQKNSPDNEAI